MLVICFDTETTGLSVQQGHRIIEIGCVEIIDRSITRQTYHHYVNPEREIDAGAVAVHGITAQSLANKPVFAEIADGFVDFIRGAQLIIHNASFDLSFLNYELSLSQPRLGKLEKFCTYIDTLALARQKHPGQKNSLDALCKRYRIDNSHRDMHGALLDARLLALVYLAMTGGQDSLFEESAPLSLQQGLKTEIKKIEQPRKLRIVHASNDELTAHEANLQAIAKKNGGPSVWELTEDKDL